jgi:ribosomal protein L7/L12
MFSIISGPDNSSVPQGSASSAGSPQKNGAGATNWLLAKNKLSERRLISELPQNDLNDKLTKIQRKAINYTQESGINSLFLIFGLLSWQPENLGKTVKAPLVIIPVSLEKTQSGQFKVASTGEEHQFNVTLAEKLRRDYKIAAIAGLEQFLDNLQTSDTALCGIFSAVQSAVREMAGWEVTKEVYLGNLVFSKYLLWNDLEILEKSGQLLSSSGLVKTLAAEQQGSGAHQPISPLGAIQESVSGTFDDVLNPKEIYTPLLADSSQLEAVARSSKNQDFVLIGPPGTGKSQTIANIIAHNLALGKTILFAAEKTAALNGVYSRLKNMELDEFCLELHSNKSNKNNVIKDIKQTLDNSRAEPPDSPDWARKTAELQNVRLRLNSFVKDLHTASPSGITPYQAVGEYLLLKDNPAVKIMPGSVPDS